MSLQKREDGRLSRGSKCRRVCKQTCRKDGVCRDGGHGAHIGDRPECHYGGDCADCGRRALCTPVGTSMMLPYEALRHGTRRQLLISHILFLVMGSSRFRARSELVQQSWCQRQKASCIFFTDDTPSEEDDRDRQPLGTGDTAAVSDQLTGTPAPDIGRRSHNWTSRRGAGSMPLIRVQDALPPSRCFCNDSARRKSHASTGFFCSSHRAATLEAQYRFLPALNHIKASAAFARGDFMWIVLVDDDSFVFASRLRSLLSLLDEDLPLYLGDFVSSPDAFKHGVQDFACGGGGSVLSAKALRQMDVDTCIDDYHSRCMQSDWMIGGCASRHNVTFIRTLGCATCDRKRADALAASGRLQSSFDHAECFFVQNMPAHVQIGIRAPAIVHGLSDADRRRFFADFGGGMADRRAAALARARQAARERMLGRLPPPPPARVEAAGAEGGGDGQAAAGAAGVGEAGQAATHHVAAAQWGQLPRAVQLMLGWGSSTGAAAETAAGARS